MASLPISFATQVYAATAAKGAGGGSKPEKGPWDWIVGKLIKEDQFYETDPIFNNPQDKTGAGTRGTTSGRKGTTGTTSGRKGTTGTTSGRKGTTVSVPQKKKGGFGGLFAKD